MVKELEDVCYAEKLQFEAFFVQTKIVMLNSMLIVPKELITSKSIKLFQHLLSKLNQKNKQMIFYQHNKKVLFKTAAHS